MKDSTICGLTLEQIQTIAVTVVDKKLGGITLKKGDEEIIIKGVQPTPSTIVAPSFAQPTAPISTAAPVSAETNDSPKTISGNVVKSPIVGTFYASSAPDKPPFVKIGDTVKKGDVIMIIESMKLMNEVKSAFDGVVKEILVENAEAVEYDQPIMIIE